MKTKSANEIREQVKRMMREIYGGCNMPEEQRRRYNNIKEIAKKYLQNICRHYGKKYGSKTWQEIGENKLPKYIYAK